MTVNGVEYSIVKLLGKGKGGYSYLVKREGNLFVLKQIHHEPCDYYAFGNKIESEMRDYETLTKIGIRMPKMIDVDIENERILKEYVENYNDGLQFIDRYEIEDMLSEYYDFSMVDMETWKLIDQLVKSECEKRGVSPDDYEQYARVCDVCVGKVLD